MAAAKACCFCCLLVLLILLAPLEFCLGIAQIVLGAKHLSDCPVQSKIPIYLLVAGCVGLLEGVISAVKSKKMKDSRDERGDERGGERPAERPKQSSTSILSNGLGSLLVTFSFIWFICGMVWIFSVSPTFVQVNPGNFTIVPYSNLTAAPQVSTTYCYEPLYKFAMAMVLLRCVLVFLQILIVLCVCCGTCLFCCCAAAAAAANQEEAQSGLKQGTTEAA